MVDCGTYILLMDLAAVVGIAIYWLFTKREVQVAAQHIFDCIRLLCIIWRLLCSVWSHDTQRIEKNKET